MTPLKLALLAGAASLALAGPAAAQHQMPGMTMPMPAKRPAAKKPAAKKPAAKKPAAKKLAPRKRAPRKPALKAASPAKQAPGQSQGHDMSTMPAMEMPPGQSMEAMPAMPMPANPDTEAAGTNLPAGDASAPPAPADHAADSVYGQPAMETGRHHLRQFHGGQKLFQLLNNIMEYRAASGRDGYRWDSEGWYGGDIGRLWLKSEGEGAFGGPLERAEVQALYSHAIDPYFNVQGGLRYDFRPDPSRLYATVGVEGLAPSFFELDGALFLSNKGELMARASAWYDQRITQRLILQPRAELNLAAQDSPAIGVGAGLSDAELALRLRYDIRREFSPYVGIGYRRAFGTTARYLRDDGERVGGWEFLAGIRTWF